MADKDKGAQAGGTATASCGCSEAESQAPAIPVPTTVRQRPGPTRPGSSGGSLRAPGVSSISRPTGGAKPALKAHNLQVPPQSFRNAGTSQARTSNTLQVPATSSRGRIPQAGQSRLPQAGTSTRTPQTAPQLVRSSVTTTSRDVARRPVTKTTTTTTKTTTRPTQGAAARVAATTSKGRMRPPGPPVQPPQIVVTAPESSSTPQSPALVGDPTLLAPSRLAKKVEKDLLKKTIATGMRASASGAQISASRRQPPVIMAKKGPVPAANQIILEQKVERGMEGEHVTEHMTGFKYGEGQQIELDVQHFDPSARLPSAPVASKEIIIIKSSVSSAAGGVTQKVKTFVHEKTGPKEPDPKEISQMVKEESKNIEEGLKMIRTKSQAPGKAKKKEPLEDVPEDLPPETLATIMHTEEQGLAMASPPTQIYKILFPDEGESSIPVSSVVPAPLQDVVVPTSAPTDWYGGFTREELEQAAARITDQLSASPRKPTDSMYTEAVKKFALPSPPSPIPPKVRKKKAKPLGREQPPWDAEDFQPIADLVGAAPSSAATSGFDISVTEPERMFPTDTSGLEYILVPQPPSHISRVQLRGSIKPLWFPGYYVALPERGRGIQLASSPSNVLLSAWKEVQPESFGEDSFVVR